MKYTDSGTYWAPIFINLLVEILTECCINYKKHCVAIAHNALLQPYPKKAVRQITKLVP
jgi:hypothetical protein